MKAKSKKSEKRFYRVMVAVALFSTAIILFAVLWNTGLIANDEKNILWHKCVKNDSREYSESKIWDSKGEAEIALSRRLTEAMDEALDKSMIEELTSNNDLDKYLVYVDSNNSITQEYIDEHFPVITVLNDRGQEKEVDELAWYYYRRLKRFLRMKEGIIIDLDYGYRSIKGQEEVIEMLTLEHGADYALYYAAAPGTSEHHTGLAIDLCLIVDGVVIDDNEAMNAETEIFGKIHELLPKYGFVLDFPYESWHIRFVGSPEIAEAYYDSGMSFWSFLDLYKQSH